jgi:hypothetical protein
VRALDGISAAQHLGAKMIDFDDFETFELTPEEEEESIARHVETCKLAEQDIYCKICFEL